MGTQSVCVGMGIKGVEEVMRMLTVNIASCKALLDNLLQYS